MEYVNTFKPFIVPKNFEYNEGSVKWFNAQIDMLCGNRKDITRHVIQFLAHNIQKPGVKIKHALLFKGIYGDGKSWLGDTLRKILGDEHVRDIDPSVVMSNFNGWATDTCIRFYEEIRITGHNRYDVTNALKPIITNNHINLTLKGKNSRNVPNFGNDIMCTNYNDCIPLNDGDRRYMIIFTPFDNADGLETYIQDNHQITKEAYFNIIYDQICYKTLFQYLMNFDISAFNANCPAPLTAEKTTMINNEKSDLQHLIEQIIKKQENKYVTSEFIYITELKKQIVYEDGQDTHPDPYLNNNIPKVLKKLNYSKDGRVRYEFGRSPKWAKWAR